MSLIQSQLMTKRTNSRKKEHTVITFEYDNTFEPTKLSEDRETSINEIADITDGYLSLIHI